jgi:hypothetical protein
MATKARKPASKSKPANGPDKTRVWLTYPPQKIKRPIIWELGNCVAAKKWRHRRSGRDQRHRELSLHSGADPRTTRKDAKTNQMLQDGKHSWPSNEAQLFAVWRVWRALLRRWRICKNSIPRLLEGGVIECKEFCSFCNSVPPFFGNPCQLRA